MEKVNKDYYSSGKLKDEFFYKEGKPILHNHYHENGILSHEIPSTNIATIHGVVRHYYESGHLAREVPFIDGLKNGREQLFWDNGKLQHTISWKNGKEHGVYNTYNENGELTLHTRYENGEELSLFMTLARDLCNLFKNGKIIFNKKKYFH